jgi:hypothetical protein
MEKLLLTIYIMGVGGKHTSERKIFRKVSRRGAARDDLASPPLSARHRSSHLTPR